MKYYEPSSNEIPSNSIVEEKKQEKAANASNLFFSPNVTFAGKSARLSKQNVLL